MSDQVVPVVSDSGPTVLSGPTVVRQWSDSGPTGPIGPRSDTRHTCMYVCTRDSHEPTQQGSGLRGQTQTEPEPSASPANPNDPQLTSSGSGHDWSADHKRHMQAARTLQGPLFILFGAAPGAAEEYMYMYRTTLVQL